MKLLNTYDDREEAEEAAEKLPGDKRLASERDVTVVTYNQFGIPNWSSFHCLCMYNLGELKNPARAPCQLEGCRSGPACRDHRYTEDRGEELWDRSAGTLVVIT